MKLQASSIYRNTLCPGSLALEDTLSPDMRYNPFPEQAGLGSLIHAVGETMLRDIAKGKTPATAKKLFSFHGIHPDSFEFERGTTAVKLYAAHFKKLLRKHKTPQIIMEEKFRVPVHGVDCVCKCDSMLVSVLPDKIMIDILDLKTGNYDYTDSARMQLAFSLAVFIKLSYGKGQKNIPIQTTSHIVQPNYYEESERIVSLPGPEIDVAAWHVLLDEWVANIKNDASTFSPGAACKMCPAIVTCPAQRNSLAVVSAADAVDIDRITPDMLETLIIRKKQIESFLDAVEQRVNSLMDSGHRFQRLYKKMSYGRRYWLNPAETEKALAYLGDDLYEPRKIKSPARVEKLAGKENISELCGKPENWSIAVRPVDDDPFGVIE